MGGGVGGNAWWVLGAGERSSGSLIASAKASLTPATRSGGRWLSINTRYTVIVLQWIFPVSEPDTGISEDFWL